MSITANSSLQSVLLAVPGRGCCRSPGRCRRPDHPAGELQPSQDMKYSWRAGRAASCRLEEADRLAPPLSSSGTFTVSPFLQALLPVLVFAALAVESVPNTPQPSPGHFISSVFLISPPMAGVVRLMASSIAAPDRRLFARASPRSSWGLPPGRANEAWVRAVPDRLQRRQRKTGSRWGCRLWPVRRVQRLRRTICEGREGATDEGQGGRFGVRRCRVGDAWMPTGEPCQCSLVVGEAIEAARPAAR